MISSIHCILILGFIVTATNGFLSISSHTILPYILFEFFIMENNGSDSPICAVLLVSVKYVS
ncbi:MAG: hypothetical protein WCG25_05110 [bacterium]